MKEHRICSSLLNPETPPCCFYAYRLHGLCRSTAALFCIGPREVPRAHVDLLRKCANSEIVVQMFSYPAVE